VISGKQNPGCGRVFLNGAFLFQRFFLPPAEEIGDGDDDGWKGNCHIPAPRAVESRQKNIADGEKEKEDSAEKLIFPSDGKGCEQDERWQKMNDERQNHRPMELSFKNIQSEKGKKNDISQAQNSWQPENDFLLFVHDDIICQKSVFFKCFISTTHHISFLSPGTFPFLCRTTGCLSEAGEKGD